MEPLHDGVTSDFAFRPMSSSVSLMGSMQTARRHARDPGGGPVQDGRPCLSSVARPGCNHE